MDDIRGLLFDNPIDVASSSVTNQTQHGDKDYDQHVRELALDKRAQPKDRAKTEEELALEAKEALEKAERKRQKRMRGESDSESDDGRPSRLKGRRKTGGDAEGHGGAIEGGLLRLPAQRPCDRGQGVIR